MSTGGIFTLITNDGKQDKMLMAVDLLNIRLRDVEISKKKLNMDPTPNLIDIERTHILYLNAHFKPFVAMGSEYSRVEPAANNFSFGSEVKFCIPSFGDFFHDMAFRVKLSGFAASTQQYRSNLNGENNFLPLSSDKVRYCEYPGERLFDSVRLDVSGNPLDVYTSDDVALHRQFEIGSDKIQSWNRCVGQQDFIQGSLMHENSSEVKWFSNGAQTWKNSHELELWVPLIFWFNTNVALSIPSVCIPYGQRFISAKITALQNLIEAKSFRNQPPVFTAPIITEMSLYINNIFVNPEIHDIFIKRVGFSLIRIHLQQKKIIDLPKGSELFSSLKFPIETIYFGMRHSLKPGDSWWRYGKQEVKKQIMPVAYTPTVTNSGTGIAFAEAEYMETQSIFTGIGLKAHGVTIYQKSPASFYNHYINYNRGKLVSPKDEHVYAFVFNLFPLAYQPSGHLNFSRSREMYLEYDAKITGQYENTAELVISAKAINFLLIADGSAVLRYAT